MQILIVLDYLLSLSTKAKEKLSKTLPESVNKSVLYADQSFNDEEVGGPTRSILSTNLTYTDSMGRGNEEVHCELYKGRPGRSIL